MSDLEQEKNFDPSITSLSFLQSLYSNETLDMKTRIEAAKAALPYEHARESASAAEAAEQKPFKVTVLRFSDYLARQNAQD